MESADLAMTVNCLVRSTEPAFPGAESLNISIYWQTNVYAGQDLTEFNQDAETVTINKFITVLKKHAFPDAH